MKPCRVKTVSSLNFLEAEYLHTVNKKRVCHLLRGPSLFVAPCSSTHRLANTSNQNLFEDGSSFFAISRFCVLYRGIYEVFVPA